MPLLRVAATGHQSVHDAHRHRRRSTAAQIMLLARPLPRRPLLRHPGRRLGGAVAALLLDLRPPRGLHPDAARLRLRLRDHPGLLAQGDLRLPDHGRGDGGDRLHQPGRVGAPHVHRRHDAAAPTPSSSSRRCSSRCPTGIKIFNWLGTMWGGKIRFATPMLFCIGFLFQFLIAGLTGVMLGVGAVRLAAHRLVLRRRALPLRADRRPRSSRSSPPSTTGSRR